MLRFLIPAIWAALISFSAQGQTYGLLLGGCYTDIYSGGQVFNPSHGLRLGAFMPVYIHNRLVLRAEAGVTALQTRPVEEDQQEAPQPYAAINFSLLGRYYASSRVCFSIGGEWMRSLQEQPLVVFNHEESIPGRSDIAALLGVAYRFKDRVEVGLRCGQGFLPATTLDIYGAAHHRYGFVMVSYLLKHRSPGFVTRHTWRNPLNMASRY